MTMRLPIMLLLVSLVSTARADWPQFRGPRGDGSSDERGLPVKWGPDENLVWKAKLPGRGSSGPVVLGDRVFVTCYSGYPDAGGRTGDLTALRRHLVCLDRKTGQVLWQRDQAAPQPEARFNQQVNQHGYATPTPVTDGEHVYVFFGKGGVFCYGLDGKEVWHADVGEYTNAFGSAASPTLYKDLVLVNATVESARMLALDKKTGRVVWKKRMNGDSWATPALAQVGDRTELIFHGQGLMTGFDPDSGEELWTCDLANGGQPSATPVVRKDVVYVMGAGLSGREVVAIRAGGRGDVSKTHVLWRNDKVGANFTSPVLFGERLYFLSNGFAVCLNVNKGEEVYRERIEPATNEYSSPVAADGKVYLFSRSGVGFVLAAGDKFERLGRNDLGDATGFTTSPAVSHGRLFVRTGTTLYCLGVK
jgi:outer membrane protein assembly factor BamB